MIRLPRDWRGAPKSLWHILDRMADAIDTALNWSTDGSVAIQRGKASMSMRAVPEIEFLAQITAGTNPYTWKHIQPLNNGTWMIPEQNQGGFNGALDGWGPAYEINDNTNVAANTHVKMHARYTRTTGNLEYWFKHQPTPALNGAGTPTTLVYTNLSSTLGSNQNNYDVSNYSTYYINPSSSFTFTGFSGGKCGKMIKIVNTSSDPDKTITVASGSGSSDSQNQYAGYGGANDVIAGGGSSSVTYVYDCVNNKWLKQAGGGTGSGSGGVITTSSYGNNTGTTTNDYVELFNVVGTHIIVGQASIKNTGGANFYWRATWTDADGDTFVSGDNTVTPTNFFETNNPPGAASAVNDRNLPWKALKIEIKSQTTDVPTDYHVAWGFLRD